MRISLYRQSDFLYNPFTHPFICASVEPFEVNDVVITELGTKINPEKDIVKFNDKIVERKTDKKVYILLNKPIGYVTTMKDQFSRDIVTDLVKIGKRVLPVGRLDMYTSGALILTDDGDFINKVTHPSNEIKKSYIATVKGMVTKEEIESLKNGVKIDDEYVTAKAAAKIIKQDKEKDITRIEIVIHEGKNRQVRKMCEAIGKKVLALHRAKIGNIGVKDLKIGQWRFLKKNEVEILLKDI